MSRLVVDFTERRPILRPPEWVFEGIRTALPPTWELAVVDAPADGGADGATSASRAAVAAVAAGAEIYLGFGVPAEVLRAGTALRWVHSGTAGIGSSLTPEMRDRDVVFTNSAGVHAEPMAETVLGMILYFARGLDLAVLGQREARWAKQRFDAADSPVREVADSTVGIVGFGGIGREVAARVRPFGARILALKRRPGAMVEGVELVFGRKGLDRILEESDFIVLSAAETPETRGLIGRDALARIRPHTALINVARGALVDEAALVEALEEGRIRGAALDVFQTEPLPASSPLWRLPNVLVTPHVSAYTHRFWERQVHLVQQNIARYLSGRPLLNMVDKAAGY